MRIYISVLLLLSFSLASFAQNKALNKDSGANHLDTLVEKYEILGLGFYNNGKFDSAIKQFIMAVKFIDSLIKIRTKNQDKVDLFITRCDIGLCYCEVKSFNKGFKYFDQSGAQPNVLLGRMVSLKALSYDQCMEADASMLMKRASAALGCYQVALDNLDALKFSPTGIIHYRYGVKDYGYSDICQTIGDMYKATSDTLTAKKYYDKIAGKK